MKTRKQLILEFMLALAPKYEELHGRECDHWNESYGRTDEGRNDDCPTEAESVFKMARRLADEYLENTK
jgi:hypothetical protein